MTEFFLKIVPPTVTAQMHKVAMRGGKPVFYDPPALESARELLTVMLKRHRPEKPYSGGVRLTVRWMFPRGRHRDGEYRITRPDTDNLQKLLKDCMTRCGFWKDDALVASETAEKLWAEAPGIYVKIEELEEGKQ